MYRINRSIGNETLRREGWRYKEEARQSEAKKWETERERKGDREMERKRRHTVVARRSRQRK